MNSISYSICFSSASILRCDSLSTLQLQLLLIPPALELLVTLWLVAKKWRSNKNERRHWLLVTEAWAYFALALADVLSRIYPADRVINITSIIVGAMSFLPILLYTIFLFLLTTHSTHHANANTSAGPLIANLPHHLRPITKYLLVTLIPLILTSNAIANFLGISYQFPSPGPGFLTPTSLSINTFLSSLTLALLSLFSALTFLLLAYQTLLVLTHQRRLSSTSEDKIHLLRGLPLLALGTKLAFIDSIAGFASMDFGGVLFRRVLHMGARAALAAGVVMGMDWEEDFRALEEDLRGGRGRGGVGGVVPPTTPAPAQTQQTPRHRPERVTIHYQRGYAPHLELRLSDLGVPDTGTLVRHLKAEWGESERGGGGEESNIKGERVRRRSSGGIPAYWETWHPERFPQTRPRPVEAEAEATIMRTPELSRWSLSPLPPPTPQFGDDSNRDSATSHYSFMRIATASRGRYTHASTVVGSSNAYRTRTLPTPVDRTSTTNTDLFSPTQQTDIVIDNYDEQEKEQEGVQEHTRARIKGIGNVSYKATPSPTQVGFMRRSIEIERGMTPGALSSDENGDESREDGDGAGEGS